MFVISNNTDKEPNITITMFVDTNIILLAVHLFLVEKDAKFKVFWPQLRSLEYQYLLPNCR